MNERFGWNRFVLRLVFAVLLVGCSYNPTGYSYYHWGIAALPEFGPEKALAGVLLVIGWVIYLRATLRSLGPIGIGLAGALCAATFWLLVSRGWLSPESPAVIEYVVLTVVAIVLAIGMSWSFIRRRLTGQVDVDDVED